MELQSQVLQQRFGVVSTPEISNYFNALTQRIARLIPAHEAQIGARLSNLQVVLLNTREPLAISAQNDRVFLSKGLVLTLENEAELVFILLHEFAHLALKHFDSGSPSSRIEQNADLYALGLMSIGGYDPRAASGAVLKFGDGANHPFYRRPLDQSYPSSSERARAIQDAIKESGWRPPALVNRRDFLKIRHRLGMLP